MGECVVGLMLTCLMEWGVWRGLWVEVEVGSCWSIGMVMMLVFVVQLSVQLLLLGLGCIVRSMVPILLPLLGVERCRVGI